MKKAYLELIRGVAALLVLITHIVSLHPSLKSMGLNTISNWGTESVIVFFILSGVVINLSYTHSPKSSGEFIANRIRRLYPQFLLGMILGFISLLVLGLQTPSVSMLAGNLLMLSTLQCYIFCTISSNLPIWSLSFEMAFYFLFSLIIKTRIKIFYWFLLSLIAIPFYYNNIENPYLKQLVAVFAFSSIWLVGYYVFEYRNKFHFDIQTSIISVSLLPLLSRIQWTFEYYCPIRFLIFALAAIPFLHFCLEEKKQGRKIHVGLIVVVYLISVFFLHKKSSSLLYNKIFYSSLPIIAVLFYQLVVKFKFKARLKEFLTGRFAMLFGKYSYSFYILHFPIFYLIAKFINNPAVYILMSISILIVLAYFSENYFQKIFIKKKLS